MKNYFTYLVPVLFPVIILSAGYSASKDTVAMDMPSAGDKKSEVRNLMKLTGNWEGKLSLARQGKSYQVAYRLSCSETSDGNGIFLSEEYFHPETGRVNGTGLAGYDPHESKIKWFTINNLGTVIELAGNWKSNDMLVLEYNGSRGGKKLSEKISFIFKNPNEFIYKNVFTLNNVEVQKTEGIFYKRNSTKK